MLYSPTDRNRLLGSDVAVDKSVPLVLSAVHNIESYVMLAKKNLTSVQLSDNT